MKLLNKGVLKKLSPLYSQNGKDPKDVKIGVKFFDPCGSWSWFATEFDPVEGRFFGLIHGHEKELGYFAFSELESYKGPLGIGIKRDLHFEGTLAEVQSEVKS